MAKITQTMKDASCRCRPDPVLASLKHAWSAVTHRELANGRTSRTAISSSSTCQPTPVSALCDLIALEQVDLLTLTR